MGSPTQRQLSLDDVVAAVRVSFGPAAVVSGAGPLQGGSFGTVWWVDLADGRRTVLKSGPPASAGLLAYEAGMVAAEAEYLRLVEAAELRVPMARLLHEATDWMFMSRLPGIPIPDLPSGVDTAGVRFESGAAIARLHTVTGSFFGYSGGRSCSGTWPEAYQRMVDALLADALTWRVELPVPPEVVHTLVAGHADALATVTTPVLVHFDLWDGNVLSTSDGAHLTGIVDGERFFWGDPIFDFASPALFRDIFERPDDPFVRGYASVAPLCVDDAVRRRLWLYQLYLYLVMIVEFPSRGRTPSAEAEFWALTCDTIRGLVAKLAD